MKPRFVLTAAAAILAGCASQGTSNTEVPLIDFSRSGLSAAPLPVLQTQWWQALGDPLLNSLMEKTLADSPALAKAQAQIQSAEAQAQAAGAAAKPHLGAQAGISRAEMSERGQMASLAGGVPINTYSFGLQGSWTFDFWGRYTAETRALLGEANAAKLSQEQARLILSQAVFSAYTQWQALEAAKANMQAQIANQQHLNRIARSRSQAGISAAVQTYPGAMTLEQMQSQLADIDGKIASVRYTLAALAGGQPYALNGLHPRPLHAAGLPQLPAKGVTLNLLGRRPDIAAAKALVEAAQDKKKAAKAAFYPDISFTAMLGHESISGAGTAFLPYRSFSLSDLLSASARQWSLGPAISLPILEGGALRANLRGQEAAYNAQAAAYNDTVLNAFRDTASAIADYQSAAQQLALREQALKDASRTVSAMQKRAAAGLQTPEQALAANAQRLSIQAEQIQTAAALQTAYGKAITALGGGWQETSQ